MLHWSLRRESWRLPVVVMVLGCQTSCLQRVSLCVKGQGTIAEVAQSFSALWQRNIGTD